MYVTKTSRAVAYVARGVVTCLWSASRLFFTVLSREAVTA